MVLEATSDAFPAADFTSDNPPSDFPPLASNDNPKGLEASYNLDISTLPRANFISALFFGRNEARLRQIIALNVSSAAHEMQRMPTQDEFNALAYHSAKAEAIASYGVPSGIVAGAYQCYATRETYKFPFVKSAEDFNPNAFSLGGRTWLTGNQARMFWHGLRFTAYGTCGGFFVGLCSAAYAASVLRVGELMDPRLKALQDALRREVKAARAALERRAEERAQARKVDVTGQGDRGVGGLWKRHRTAIGPNDTQGDDASPSTGQQETDFAQSIAVEERLYGNDTGRGEMSEAGEQAVDVRPPPPTRQTTWSRAAARVKTNSQDSDTSAAGGFSDSYDDASPTAMDVPSSSSTDAGSRGSAWERIRREAATVPSSRLSRGRGAQQRSGQGGDSGGTDDREQAQREFDAQLERERQGGSFGETSSRGREW